jgi:hypothetical protein
LRPTIPPVFHLPQGLTGTFAALLILALLLSLPAIRRRPAVLLFAATLLVVGVWAACGGSSGGGGTPPPTTVPAVSLSASGITFTSQNIGTTSAAQSVTLSNTGNAVLDIASITLTGTNAGDFTKTTTCGSTLAAGSNCSITAQFAPTATGTRSGIITITDNASGSPHTISLTGTGAGQPTPTGTYPILINAVSGGDSHNLTVNVVVQ